jgi:hypothetical protein
MLVEYCCHLRPPTNVGSRFGEIEVYNQKPFVSRLIKLLDAGYSELRRLNFELESPHCVSFLVACSC